MKYHSDTLRWKAVANRDTGAAHEFYYGVTSTAIFCVPGCPSRQPKRENTVFFDTPAEAMAAGYRACKRCRPDAPAHRGIGIGRIVTACRAIESSIEEGAEPPPLRQLAVTVGLSPAHFQRLFTEQVGVSPRVYALALRDERIRDALIRGDSVTQAIYDAGYNSASRFYERAGDALGMQPRTYARGGKGLTLWCASAMTSLGLILAAFTERGVCSVEFGQSEEELLSALTVRFHQARILDGGLAFAEHLAEVVAFIETPSHAIDLPLDIQGTAFQQRVWHHLRTIPPGQTRTYSQVAEAMGIPESVRAVAGACAKNRIAVAVPCHRVVGKNGSLTGYHWGLDRKKALLKKEQEE